jgi:type IV pilus assembly protein PilE
MICSDPRTNVTYTSIFGHLSGIQVLMGLTMKMYNHINKGFSLIEVMVIVVIIAILAIATYPSYNHYLVKSHRTEGQIALLTLAQKMERYYAENHTYVGATFAHLGSANTSGDNATNAYYTLSIADLSTTGFLLIATPKGSQATQDTKCKTLALNQLEQKGRFLDNTLVIDANCWR